MGNNLTIISEDLTVTIRTLQVGWFEGWYSSGYKIGQKNNDKHKSDQHHYCFSYITRYHFVFYVHIYLPVITVCLLVEEYYEIMPAEILIWINVNKNQYLLII